MRAIICTIVLLSLCVTLVIANAVALQDILKSMTELADGVLEARDEPYKLRDIFAKHRSLLAISIESDELERMNELIESLISAYESKDSSQITKYCRLIADLCYELSTFEQISIESVL